MRARFRVATSSFCFPHEFPHSTPSISDGSLKNHRTTIDLKEKNTGEMKMKISHTVIYQF